MKVILFFILCVLTYSKALSKNINDIMSDILASEIKKEECVFTKRVEFLILDKIEGKSENIHFAIGADFTNQNLKLKVSKCCLSEIQSYAFTSIENTKIKKEIFKGWFFSKNTTKSGIEDSKFDVILLKCF